MTGGEQLGLMVILASLGYMTVCAFGMRRAERSVDWPTVGGRVLQSEVRLENLELKTWSGRPIVTLETEDEVYRPVVVYEYAVDGVTYRGTRIRWGAKAMARRSSAEELVAAYPVGRTVAVHYDPRNPGEAVLRTGEESFTGPGTEAALGFVVGILFVCIGLFAFAAG